MNGEAIFKANDDKVVEYSKLLHTTKKTGAETKRLKEVDRYVAIIDEVDDIEYGEDGPIIQEIDAFDDLVGGYGTSSGEGITFLPDDSEQLLNRLNIIIEARRHGHQS